MVTMNDFNKPVIEEFRANNGTVGGPWTGVPLLLLTTTGVKSGLPRTNPLGYCMVDGRIVVIASYNGAPEHPAWYRNLVTNPIVTIESGSERFTARALSLEGESWDRAHAEFLHRNAEIATHHARTTRKIPYVAFERIDETAY